MADKKDSLSNYFGEIQTAHVYAYYKSGEFYDYDTHEKVQLEERHQNEPFDKENPNGILVKIIVPLIRTIDVDYERHQKREDKRILPAHTRVIFEMEKYGYNERLQFVAVIGEDLYMTKKGNKEWKLGYCPCKLISGKEVYRDREFEVEPIETGSLNQLFTKVSVKYRPDNASHNYNAFKAFRVYETGVLLDSFRNS